MSRKSRYSPEFRERAIHLLLEHQSEYNSRWAAMTSVAGKVGCTAESLRKWVRQTEINQGKRVAMSSAESDQPKELMRENRELKQANEILRKAAAFFAQVEFDRRPRK